MIASIKERNKVVIRLYSKIDLISNINKCSSKVVDEIYNEFMGITLDNSEITIIVIGNEITIQLN